MNHAPQIKLSEHPAGRVVLLLLALRRDEQWRWHGRAICREVMPGRSKPADAPLLSSVTLGLDAPSAAEVWFSGEFNSWSSTALPLLWHENWPLLLSPLSEGRVSGRVAGGPGKGHP